jgi:hypothetical protein
MQVVVDNWVAAVRANLGTLPEGPNSALINDLPSVLLGLIDVLEGKEFSSTAFLNHANSRHLWSAFSAEHLRREYRLLRKVIFAALERDGLLSAQDRDTIFDYLDEGLAIASRRLDELSHFNDQLERQYLKLIERLVTESAQMRTLAESAEGLLEVVRQGMHADAAALLLYQADTLELRLASSTAISRQLALIYRAAVALASATVQTADSTDARLLAAEELGTEAYEALKGIGICWLVFVALPQSTWLPGTLCLGFREKPAFEPVALHLLKVLGERLTVFLSRIDVFEHSSVALERARRDAAVAEAERARLESEELQREQVAASILVDVSSVDGRMQMSVHNEGPPLSPEDQARILEPFERTERGAGVPGWGIGLTFVHGMVKAHGGSVSVESSAGCGTTFTVRNPMDSRPFQRG